MNELFKLIGIGVLAVLGFISMILLITLPAALLGWLLLLFINIFTPVAYGYWSCVVVGIVVPLLLNMSRLIFR